jgi:hypothetical protein
MQMQRPLLVCALLPRRRHTYPYLLHVQQYVVYAKLAIYMLTYGGFELLEECTKSLLYYWAMVPTDFVVDSFGLDHQLEHELTEEIQQQRQHHHLHALERLVPITSTLVQFKSLLKTL